MILLSYSARGDGVTVSISLRNPSHISQCRAPDGERGADRDESRGTENTTLSNLYIYAPHIRRITGRTHGVVQADRYFVKLLFSKVSRS